MLSLPIFNMQLKVVSAYHHLILNYNSGTSEYVFLGNITGFLCLCTFKSMTPSLETDDYNIEMQGCTSEDSWTGHTILVI